MAALVGAQATSYDLTNGVIVNMDEAIYLYDSDDLPLLTGLGADGLSVIGSAPVDQTTFKWLDEQRLAPRTTLGGTITTGDTFLTVAADDRPKFSTGDVITIRKAGAQEVLRVTGYGSTTDSLTLTRALAGTAVGYTAGATIIGLGTALAEGSTPENVRFNDTTTRENYTQIFGPTKIAMSGTDRRVPRYGIPDQWAHQLHHKMLENAQSREQAFLYGSKYNSTTTKIRATGGLVEFITTRVDSTNTTLSVLKVQANLQLNFNDGGVPDRFMGNPAALVDLNDIANTSIVRQTLDDPMRGRVRVAFLETEFGSLTLVRNRYCAPTDAFAFKRDGVKRRRLRPLVFEALGKTGDFDQGQLVCEEGLQVKGEKHSHRYNSLSYT